MALSLSSGTARIVSSCVGGFFLLFALLSYTLARYQLDRLADEQLMDNARIVNALAELTASDQALSDHTPDARSFVVRAHEREPMVGFQIWSKANRLVAATDALRALALDASPAGMATMSIDGASWRIYTLLGDEGRWVRVGERSDGLAWTDRTLFFTALSSLMAVPILALLMRVAVGRSVRPINRLAEQVAAWRPHQAEPIGGDIPCELVPVVASINSLLRRVNQADT